MGGLLAGARIIWGGIFLLVRSGSMSLGAGECRSQNTESDRNLVTLTLKERAAAALQALADLNGDELPEDVVDLIETAANIAKTLLEGKPNPLALTSFPSQTVVRQEQFQLIENLCSLQNDYVEARKSVEAVCDLFRERFRYINLVVQMDKQGRFESIPVCHVTDDPLRMLCKKSRALIAEGELPALTTLTVNFVTRDVGMYSNQERRMEELVTSDEIEFVEGDHLGPVVRESDQKVLALKIYESGLRDEFSGYVSFHDLINRELRKSVEGKLRATTSGVSMNEYGFFEESISDTVYPFAVLISVQKAILEAHKPQGMAGLLRPLGRGAATNGSIERDINIEPMIVVFWGKYAEESFQNLDSALEKIEEFSGLSAEHSKWITSASKIIIDEDSKEEMDLDSLGKLPTFTEGQLNLAKPHFESFYRSVRRLIDNNGIWDNGKKKNAARAALADLEEGLTSFSNRKKTW
jgi:hypothetical protein